MTDEELNALVRAYVYAPSESEAAELLKKITDEYTRRGVPVYKSEDA